MTESEPIGISPPAGFSRRRVRSASAEASGSGVLAAWLLSLLVHMGVIGITLLFVFPFTFRESPPPPMIEAQVVGDIDAAPGDADPSPQPLEFSEGFSPQPARHTPDPSSAADALAKLSFGAGAKVTELPILGIGPGGGIGDGDLGKSGLGAGGGAAPEFFGAGGSVRGVRSVVYVVDRSGSMIDTFARVRAELKRSITSLRRSQKFHVIFFNSGEPLESPPRRLVNAIEGNRRPFFEFLDSVDPSGGTHPENALQRALSLEPDLIYLLSDGINFDPHLPNRLDEWNRERRTRIFTIAYLDPTGREMLEAIAREHRGEFKFVSEFDVP